MGTPTIRDLEHMRCLEIWRTIGDGSVRLTDVTQDRHDAHYYLQLPVENVDQVTARAYGIDGPSDGAVSVLYSGLNVVPTVSATGAAGVDAITVDPNISGPATSVRARLRVRTNSGAQRIERHGTLAELTAAGAKFFV